MVPAATGMPAGSPVCAAAAALTRPATSCGQRSGGSGGSAAPPTASAAQSSIQVLSFTSYSGTHWLAEWWSSTYSPVRR